MLALRKFNDAGILEFSKRYIEMKETGKPVDFSDLVENENLTEFISNQKTLDLVRFATRMECGEYFYNLFESNAEALHKNNVDPLTDVGLWCWLTAVWAKYLQFNSDGKFNINQSSALARWIYEPLHPRRYYRHLLAGPYRLYFLHAGNTNRIKILMYNHVTKPNTAWVEQICSRKEIVDDGSIMDFIHEMFFDESMNKPRTKPKNFSKVGDIRRFGVVYNQLVVNWDMHGMPTDALKAVIPSEFDAWFARPRKKSVRKSISARRRSSI